MDVAGRLLEELDGWGFEQGHLVKTYEFDDFAGPLQFVATIGAIAEQQGHHPDLYITWGKVSVEIWTHKIDGLTESDFILAAKFDEVRKPTPGAKRAVAAPAAAAADDDDHDDDDDDRDEDDPAPPDDLATGAD
jgi:4a-hydroxytetrahydrobiopterin dehydratase